MSHALQSLNVHLAKAQPSATYRMMDRVAARRASVWDSERLAGQM